MSIRVLRRIVETFFRRWPIYTAVVLVAIGLGALSASRTETSYASSGTIFVDTESLVASQSGVPSSSGFTYLSPAEFTSQELGGLIQTDVFLAAVVERTGLDLVAGPDVRVVENLSIEELANLESLSGIEPAPDPVAWAKQAEELRASFSSWGISDSLIAVKVATSDPELSFELAKAMISEFVQFQITLDVAESAASEAFFTDLAGDYEEAVVGAQAEVDTALRRVAAERQAIIDENTVNLEPEEIEALSAGELTLEQATEINRLKEAEVIAVTRFRETLDNVEVAKLAMLQTETDIRQSYSVFDSPRLPTQPEGNLMEKLSLVAGAALAGLGLAMLVPIMMGFFGRVVLFSEDLEDLVPIVSVVPTTGRRSTRLTLRREPAEDDKSDPSTEEIERLATQTTAFLPADLATGRSKDSSDGYEAIEPGPSPAEAAKADDSEATDDPEPAEAAKADDSETTDDPEPAEAAKADDSEATDDPEPAVGVALGDLFDDSLFATTTKAFNDPIAEPPPPTDQAKEVVTVADGDAADDKLTGDQAFIIDPSMIGDGAKSKDEADDSSFDPDLTADLSDLAITTPESKRNGGGNGSTSERSAVDATERTNDA